MLQASVLNVSSIFSEVCLQVCLSGCYVHFTNMLYVFCLDVPYILQWLFLSVFKCFYKCFRRMLQVFQLFRTYVLNVSFGCFKSTSGVACPSSPSAALLRCLLLFSMLMIFQVQHRWDESLEQCGIRADEACGTEQARGAASERELRTDVQALA
jgi:hypothetical protein